MATAPIRTIAWEPLYATGAALEKAKRQKDKKEKTKQNKKTEMNHSLKGGEYFHSTSLYFEHRSLKTTDLIFFSMG